MFNPQSLGCAFYKSTSLNKIGPYIPSLLLPYTLALFA